MFLNQIKIFFIKNKIKKRLTNVLPDNETNTIKKVGLIVDEASFAKRELLVKELVSKGIIEANISILIFKDKIYKNEIFDKPTFSNKDLSWSGSFTNADVNYFVDQKFDLLINYYDKEKASLLQASNLSKASFKVGFSDIDKRINHFMINSVIENYKLFVDELFKYLKILKKA